MSYSIVNEIAEGLAGILQQQPIQIVGSWSSARRLVYKSGAESGVDPEPMVEAIDHRWCATVECTIPLVAIGFLLTPTGSWWIKSPSRVHPLTLQVSLSTWRTDRPTRATFTPSLHHSYLPGVPVPFCGDVESFPLRVESPATCSVIEVASPGDVSFAVVVLPHHVVKTGRNHLWQLRSELAHRVPEPPRVILTRGRSGRIPATPGTGSTSKV